MKKLNCILLIDDNVDDNYFHTLAIKKANAAKHIRTATSGENALEYIARNKLDPEQYPEPDLIFLDINMPGMNGFEFLEKVRDNEIFNSWKTVIIVMLTSSLNPNDEKMAQEKFSNVIHEYQNKPLTTVMLKKMIEDNF